MVAPATSGYLKCDQSELRCVVRIKYILRIKDLVPKNEKYLINNFIVIIGQNGNILDISG